MKELKNEKYFLDWEETFSAGVNLAGGKGWNIGRLAHYGFEVPLGGTVTTLAYQNFIRENGLDTLIQEVVNYAGLVEDKEEILRFKLDQLRENFRNGKLPEELVKEVSSRLKNLNLFDDSLSVRSSASSEDSQVASFAGIHDSYLNVKGLDQVLSAVKECYASLWSLRALSYRRKMGFKDAEVIPAVVIMKMAKAVASGIGFSCNPQTGRLDEVMINANYGLGESVVGGTVDPDQYILDAMPLLPKIVTKVIGQKQWMTVTKDEGGTELQKPALLGLNPDDYVLSDTNINKLGLLILRVFEALGEGEMAQDVEWVFDGKTFWLVQARPVTRLPRYTYPELKDQPEIWSNANFKDCVPMVITTLNRRILSDNIYVSLTAVLKEIGYISPAGLQYSKFKNGRVYLNPSLLQWEFFDTMGMPPKETNAQLGGSQPEIKLPKKRAKHPLKKAANKLKILFTLLKVQRNAEKIFGDLGKHCEYWMNHKLTELNDKEIVNALVRRQEESAPFSKLGILNNVAGVMINLLVKALEKDFPTKAHTMANALLMGRGDITSAEQGYKLVELAKIARNDQEAKRFLLAQPFQPLSWEAILREGSTFKQRFREFLKEYGHRAVYERDLTNPRWREDPSYLLKYIQSILDTADLNKLKEEQKHQLERVQKQVQSIVPFYRILKINWLVRQAVRGEALREKGKSELVKLTEPLREHVIEIGRRFKERGLLEDSMDVFHCSFPDVLSILLGYWNGQGLKVLIADRKRKYRELQNLDSPDLIIDEKVHFAEPISVSSEGFFSGLGVASGRSEGRAKLLVHPEEGLDQDEVLVAPSTDPGWTPLFLKASGIIMETGGFLSHGAIVAREYGIPAVVNIPGIMRLIKSGDSTVVDGDEGKVFLR